MSTINPRIPPNSNESEQSVLGGLLAHSDKWEDISFILDIDDFYDKKHTLIFSAIKTLKDHDEVTDVNTVLVQLQKNGDDATIGGLTYLLVIIENTPSIDNIVSYARHVRELSVYRKLIRSANDIADLAYNPQELLISGVLDQAELKILRIRETIDKRNNAIASSKDILPYVKEEVEHRANNTGIYGLETGFSELDKLTNGLQKSDLVIIAGRPSMGKTSFAMNIVEHAAIINKKTCLIFSLEMPKEQLMMRMISSSHEINMGKMRNGAMNASEWDTFNGAIERLSDTNIIIDDSAGLTPDEIRASARKVWRDNGHHLDLIVIDYIGMVRVPGARDKNSEIGEISRSIKAMAKDLSVPVIALSQLNRNVETRKIENKGRMPQMSDIRDSGTIEQDADLIAFVYRDEQYHGEGGYQNPDEIGTADIKIAKHRNGQTGNIRLAFDGQFTKFRNLSPRGLAENEEYNLHKSVEEHIAEVEQDFSQYAQEVDFNNLDDEHSPI